MSQKNKWIKAVITSLNNLGGQGSLNEIYEEVENGNTIKLNSYTDWKAQIRKNLYLHSSDCEIFRGTPGDETDLIYATDEKGSGKWGLRNYKEPTNIYSFIRGQVYKRSDIHDNFGGNRQRGISACKNHPMIFIFSGKSGEDYGYKDGWQDANTFFYTGEGQSGDQVFKEGNKALRDHIKNGKDVYLFEKTEASPSGMYEFKDQLTNIGYHTITGNDKEGNHRKMIVFEFETTQKINNDSNSTEPTIASNDLSDLRNMALKNVNEYQNTTYQQRKTIIRKRAAAIKKYALKRANGICEACKEDAPFQTQDGSPFLEVHHLQKLSDGGPDHPENVAAICPNCHRKAHYSRDAKEFNKYIVELISEQENTLTNKIGE
ncbi:HNH endonuclease [Halobacillus sp. GSS1]|uniref:HNH endonuclease n=1 Tax=Halobacillus sp. GSS1 TaxID=2815919 RepID=UPI001A8FF4BA|nr:HNH endonuclease [Halobacillus sp. GSS1]MBN9654706.1 HNH endonuclease [Halobacillus sp. GSS1]